MRTQRLAHPTPAFSMDEALDPLVQLVQAERDDAILLRLVACAAMATLALAAALSLAT